MISEAVLVAVITGILAVVGQSIVSRPQARKAKIEIEKMRSTISATQVTIGTPNHGATTLSEGLAQITDQMTNLTSTVDRMDLKLSKHIDVSDAEIGHLRDDVTGISGRVTGIDDRVTARDKTIDGAHRALADRVTKIENKA